MSKGVAGKLEEDLYACPIGCEYRHNLWVWLFSLSCVLNVLFGLSVLPGLIQSMRRDRNRMNTSTAVTGQPSASNQFK